MCICYINDFDLYVSCCNASKHKTCTVNARKEAKAKKVVYTVSSYSGTFFCINVLRVANRNRELLHVEMRCWATASACLASLNGMTFTDYIKLSIIYAESRDTKIVVLYGALKAAAPRRTRFKWCHLSAFCMVIACIVMCEQQQQRRVTGKMLRMFYIFLL